MDSLPRPKRVAAWVSETQQFSCQATWQQIGESFTATWTVLQPGISCGDLEGWTAPSEANNTSSSPDIPNVCISRLQLVKCIVLVNMHRQSLVEWVAKLWQWFPFGTCPYIVYKYMFPHTQIITHRMYSECIFIYIYIYKTSKYRFRWERIPIWMCTWSSNHPLSGVVLPSPCCMAALRWPRSHMWVTMDAPMECTDSPRKIDGQWMLTPGSATSPTSPCTPGAALHSLIHIGFTSLHMVNSGNPQVKRGLIMVNHSY